MNLRNFLKNFNNKNDYNFDKIKNYSKYFPHNNINVIIEKLNKIANINLLKFSKGKFMKNKRGLIL